jgi:hypothetical protein
VLSRLDIDDDGSTSALTDGLMILRASFGLTGTAVTNNALGLNPNRGSWAAIRSYLNADLRNRVRAVARHSSTADRKARTGSRCS